LTGAIKTSRNKPLLLPRTVNTVEKECRGIFTHTTSSIDSGSVEMNIQESKEESKTF